MDHRRLHDDARLPVLHAHDARRMPRPTRSPRRAARCAAAERRINYIRNSVKADRRRLRRHGHALRVGRDGPAAADLEQGVPRTRPAAVGDPAPSCRALPLPGGPVQGAAQTCSRYHVDDPHELLQRPGLLDDPERPDEPDRERPAAAVLPDAADAGTSQPTFSLTTTFAPLRRADPGRVHGRRLRPGAGLRQDPGAAAAAQHDRARPDAGAEQLRVRDRRSPSS